MKVELDWLKKVRAVPVNERHQWLEPVVELSLSRQCALAGVSRGSYYYRSAPENELTIDLMHRIDALYTDYPFYGSRRMTAALKRLGYRINRKRIRDLMAKMGLEAIYPKPNTSQSHPEHRVYRIC